MNNPVVMPLWVSLIGFFSSIWVAVFAFGLTVPSLLRLTGFTGISRSRGDMYSGAAELATTIVLSLIFIVFMTWKG